MDSESADAAIETMNGVEIAGRSTNSLVISLSHSSYLCSPLRVSRPINKTAASASETTTSFSNGHANHDLALMPAACVSARVCADRPISPDQNNTHGRIYVGNVAWTVTSDELRKEFQKFGEIRTIQLQVRNICLSVILAMTFSVTQTLLNSPMRHQGYGYIFLSLSLLYYIHSLY